MPDLLTADQVLVTLQRVEDPELGVNIVDLGLVYGIETADHSIQVTMTMTSPGCPLAGFLEKEARSALQTAFPTVSAIRVEVVWEPQWSPMMMSWKAKQQLGWSG